MSDEPRRIAPQLGERSTYDSLGDLRDLAERRRQSQTVKILISLAGIAALVRILLWVLQN